MGSMITLGIGRLEIDWGKNNFFTNHSRLFQAADLSNAPYYHGRDGEVVEIKRAYVRKLGDIVPRLELLGYTVAQCRQLYDETVQEHPDYHRPDEITFDDFASALAAANVDHVMTGEEYAEVDFDHGELAAMLLANPEFKKTLSKKAAIDKDVGLFFENLDAYIVLRLLAENSRNLDKEVVWGFDDIVEGGYATEDEVWQPLAENSKYLLVTEGSSDAGILRKSLTRLFPGVADFFNFIDVRDNYPFTGTGNLVNFCIGLSAIKVLNKTVFVFDNDAAGREAYERALSVNPPSNIKCLLLPDQDTFRRFETVGPSGASQNDINGKAAAIECYLDLAFDKSSKPVVRWTAFNKKLQTYQGELVDKEAFTKGFHKNYASSTYNLAGLKVVWEAIFRKCITP